jgi:hypothetical protein
MTPRTQHRGEIVSALAAVLAFTSLRAKKTTW